MVGQMKICTDFTATQTVMASPILQSWLSNAARWSQLLDAGGLESRKLVTNQAIVSAILALQPQRLLDVGCGEGWLCRAVQPHGIATWGIDGVPALIAAAESKGPGRYSIASYEQLAQGYPALNGLFNVVVFNFCLYEYELTERLLARAAEWVVPGGCLLIQTLHEEVLRSEDGRLPDTGYQAETWAGLAGFSGSYQWYFRRLDAWQQTLQHAGWQLQHTTTTQHPHSGKRLSWVMQAHRSVV
jgi:SAM-dependent methyltransferase